MIAMSEGESEDGGLGEMRKDGGMGGCMREG